jgi:hypothetical protein
VVKETLRQRMGKTACGYPCVEVLRGISSIEAANAAAPEFVVDYNGRFAKAGECTTILECAALARNSGQAY